MYILESFICENHQVINVLTTKVEVITKIDVLSNKDLQKSQK